MSIRCFACSKLLTDNKYECEDCHNVVCSECAKEDSDKENGGANKVCVLCYYKESIESSITYYCEVCGTICVANTKNWSKVCSTCNK